MFTLRFSDHALRRYLERTPGRVDILPKHVSYVLDVDGARHVRKLVKELLKMIPSSMRVALPPNKQWGKFLRHGIQDTVTYCAKDFTTFVIMKEGVNHTVLTITKPPKEMRDAEIDYGVTDPSGVAYLKDVSAVVVPYFINDELTYDVGVSVMVGREVPLYFGKVPNGM